MSAANAALGFLRIKSKVSFATRFMTPASAVKGARKALPFAMKPKTPVMGMLAPIAPPIARA